MSYTNGLDNPELYFQTKLYTGDASDPTAITFDGSENMQPDMLWFKARDAAYDHAIYDSARGVQKDIRPNASTAQTTHTTAVSSFNADGFSISAQESRINENGTSYVVWGWNTQGGAGSSNEAGTINSTTTSVGQTQGISISTYTGTNTAATIGHGLGAVPKMVIVKRTNGAAGWYVHHQNLTSANYHIILNTTAAQGTGTYQWNDTLPTSTVFSVGTGSDTNGSSDTYVAYCFAPKQGFSSIGSWIGNATTDGPFVYTGFRPAFVLTKPINYASAWVISDNKRPGYNNASASNLSLQPNTTGVEITEARMDLLSNGFKLRTTAAEVNAAYNYMYIAFAEAPFVNSNGVPCNAR